MMINSNNVTAAKVSGVAYWASTVFAALALAATGTADLSRLPTIMEALAHLGYPPYVATILGAWQLLGAWAILVSSDRRIQEWAYAGVFFTLTGAALSHVASGDSGEKVLLPLVLLGSIMVSLMLRPAREAPVRSEFAGPKAA